MSSMNDITTNYIGSGELLIEKSLQDFVNNQVLPNTNIEPSHFWSSLGQIVKDFAPRNAELLKKRDTLQKQIDDWHIRHRNQSHNEAAYKQLLEEITYLVPEPEDFEITSADVDPEIAEIAAPQLVVPLDNARYVLNAANARWGSLYDALYASDAISQSKGCKKVKKYNPIRGEKVIRFVRTLLDRYFPLEKGTHNHVVKYHIVNNDLRMVMGDMSETTLLKPQSFVAYTGEKSEPDTVLLKNNGLHFEIRFGEGFYIGRRDHANIYDVHIESALTTIMDCEDSVASVDSEDKIQVYKNWLGLMQGTLNRTIEKDDEVIHRNLNPDRQYLSATGEPYTVPGRSVLLVRNVGMHLYTDTVLLNNEKIPETLLDAMVTAASAKHDLLNNSQFNNSRTGSIYIVKPKMHGPEEVALANELFDRVEDALGLKRHTLKIGIMDEERRTSVNLKACIKAAQHRVVFINTGFLDRTGDDIHTSMEAGAMVSKAELQQAEWLQAYENSNVDNGLLTGFKGKAQIGKGMWAKPDKMMDMLETKIKHLKAGASTSWVPSPTAASLHVLHYHKFNVGIRQSEILDREKTNVDNILKIPVIRDKKLLDKKIIQTELENNIQGILGYVVRWVGQGVGCSKVPDIENIGLMEDCATLRISSQHIANWLHHDIVDQVQVEATLKRMAIFVDRQNENDPNYIAMTPDTETSIPFLAAHDLIFKAREQANGYTEFILYQRRKEMKKFLHINKR